ELTDGLVSQRFILFSLRNRNELCHSLAVVAIATDQISENLSLGLGIGNRVVKREKCIGAGLALYPVDSLERFLAHTGIAVLLDHIDKNGQQLGIRNCRRSVVTSSSKNRGSILTPGSRYSLRNGRCRRQLVDHNGRGHNSRGRNGRGSSGC